MISGRPARPILTLLIPNLWGEESPTSDTEPVTSEQGTIETTDTEMEADPVGQADAPRLLGADLIEQIKATSNADVGLSSSSSKYSLASAATASSAYDDGPGLHEWGPSEADSHHSSAMWPSPSPDGYLCCAMPLYTQSGYSLDFCPCDDQDRSERDPDLPYLADYLTASPEVYTCKSQSGESSPAVPTGLASKISEFDSWFDQTPDSAGLVYPPSFLEPSPSSSPAILIHEVSLPVVDQETVQEVMVEADMNMHETDTEPTPHNVHTERDICGINSFQAFEQELSAINEKAEAQSSRTVNFIHTVIHEELSRQIANKVRLALDLATAVDQWNETHSTMQTYLDAQVRTFAQRVLATSVDDAPGGAGEVVAALLTTRDILKQRFRDSLEQLAEASTALLDEAHIEHAYCAVSRWAERWRKLEVMLETWRGLEIDEMDGKKVAMVLELWLDGFSYKDTKSPFCPISCLEW